MMAPIGTKFQVLGLLAFTLLSGFAADSALAQRGGFRDPSDPFRLLSEDEVEDELKLTDAQVTQWEKLWSTSVGRLEMESVGQAWTREEKDAGAANTRALTANAPPPQMIFYRPKSSEAMFVKLRLSYRK